MIDEPSAGSEFSKRPPARSIPCPLRDSRQGIKMMVLGSVVSFPKYQFPFGSKIVALDKEVH